MGRFFARHYDRIVAGAEEAGIRAWRQALLVDAAGTTLEVGAGTGLNLPHYPPTVTRLIAAEPDPHMREQLEARLDQATVPTEVLDAPAEDLPLEDGSVDTVVCTLVLCTVGDLERSLRELHRVLRPGGRLLYLEHVADTRRAVRLFQRALEPLWRVWADGCRLSRRTGGALERAGFQLATCTAADMPRAPFWVRPSIRGVATRA